MPVEEFVRECVDIPRFAACCAECRGFGKTWACPPYDFDPMDIWQSFSTVLLYGKKVNIPEEEREVSDLGKAYNALLAPVKSRLLNELYELERQYPGALALSAGGCDICSSCGRAEGVPCLFPEKMRHSIESLGGNAEKCISEYLSESILWAENNRLPEHFILLGALLKK